MNYKYIGKLGKTFGLDGNIRFVIDDSDLDFIEEAQQSNEAIFVGIDGFKIPFFIKNINFKKGLIQFNKIAHEDQLKELVGQEIFILNDDADEKVIQDLDLLLDLEVVSFEDQHVIGKLIRIEENPAHPIAIVDQNGTEVMIPIVEEWIKEINVETQSLVMELPDGLV